MSRQRKEQQEPQYREETEDQYDEAMSLLAINSMSYSLPVASSNSSSRIQQQYMFNPSSFESVGQSTMAQVIFNTGSYYINGSTSTLQFSVNVKKGDTDVGADNSLFWAFGIDGQAQSGSSAVSFFREVNLVSRSGEMLQRNLYSNVLAAALAPIQKGAGGQNVWSAAGGASFDASTNTFTFPKYNCDEEIFFSIPLSKLLSFFGEAACIPALLISGAKLSLAFDNFLNSIVLYVGPTSSRSAGNPPSSSPTVIESSVVVSSVSVNFKDMQLMLDAMTIFDQSQQLINAAASSLQTSGIQYLYLNTFQTRTTLASESNTIDILLSAAKLKDVVLRFRNANAPNAYTDNMAGLPIRGDALGTSIFKGGANTNGKLGGGSVRLRIGSDLLTLLPITNAGQLYANTVTALCDTKNGLLSDVDPMHNRNKPIDVGVSYAEWYYGGGCSTIAFDCEKSNLLGISGLQSNNSRALQLELTGINASGNAGEKIVMDVFVRYISCANTSVENTVVDK